MMKKYKHIIAVLMVFCLFAGLTQLAFAAVDASPMIINGTTIDKITASGVADTITVASNSYSIKAVDKTNSGCSTTYSGQPRTITFTNTYNGWIKITYTISGSGSTGGSGTVNAGDNCTVENGVITLQKDGVFKVVVTSSSNNKASSSGNYTAVFKPTAIEYQELTPAISFTEPAEHGTFTVTAKDGTAVAVPGAAESPSYTLTASPASGYQVCSWVFTNNSGTKTYFGTKSATTTYTASEEGTITCEFMKSGSAMYTVGNASYGYLDQAITAAGSSGTIVLTGSGSVYHSTVSTNPTFEIPGGVTLVLPYAAGQTTVQSTDTSSNKYFPYGNYAQGTGFSAQPGSLAATNVELTIPSGTTVKNNGIIAVGGTIQGNGAASGAHSNLKIEKDGVLELKSSTSVLSAIGYVYGEGSVVANGSGAKILQPLALLRSGSWGWSVAATGTTFSGMAGLLNPGMETYPADAADGINPSPRYATQNIQCTMEMKCGDTMYGYADQYCSGHYMCTVTLLGTDSGSFIVLNSDTTVTSTYAGSNKSTLYGNVGKLTLTITGGATQGKPTLSQNAMSIKLNSWPMPIPYNYDLVLQSGTYTLSFDVNLYPGAGLTIGEGATLNVPSGVELAVFTGTNDHSTYGVHNSSGSSSTTSYKATPSSPNYPANSTLSGPSGGSMMANLVVDGGTLSVQSGGSFGGVVQTTNKDSSMVIMNGNTGRFTRQLGLTGKCNDTDSDDWFFSGETVYEFYPQYFDASGTLQTMVSGKTYSAVSIEPNAIATFSFDLYTTSANVATKESHTETINATADGRWCAHSYTGEVTTAATCSTDGVKTYTCSACGDEYTEVIKATGHSWQDATCTVPKTCSVCQATEGEAKGHTAGTAVKENEVPATCIAGGSYDSVVYCSVCNTELSRTAMTSEQAAHRYTSEVTEEPGCTTVGTKTFTCGACGDSYTEGIPATGHKEETVAGKAATCTATGLTDGRKCGTCGETLTAQEVIPVLGHDEEVHDAKAPTCTEIGWDAYVTCSRCDYSTYNEKAKLGHTEVIDAAGAPTCTETGLTEGKHCSVCGEVIVAQETVAALGHSWTDATCADPKTCSVCGATEGEATGHSHEATVTTAVTCTTDGVKTYTCTGCGNTYTETIAAPGHSLAQVEAKAPTCTEKGWAAYEYCSVCDYTTYKEVAATGHSYTSEETKAPTCTEKGEMTYTCGNDASHTYTEEIKATGHSLTQVEAKAPTCTEAGYEAYEFCSVCDYTTYKEVAATGHEYDSVVTPPTVDAQGYTTHTCTVCGDSYVDSYTDALTAVAQVGEQKYETLAAAVEAAQDGQTIVALTDITVNDPVMIPTGVTLNFNGNTVTGTVLGRLALNGGMLVTAEGYKMAGPTAEYYQTTNAVLTMDAKMDLVFESGEVTLVPAEWWSLDRQRLTVGQNAKFIIPEDKVLQIRGTVVIEGEVDISGTANLYETYATIQAAEGLRNITTTAGDTVLYTDGTYSVHSHTEGEVVVENNVAPDCENAGSYDNVVYCSVCSEEISRETVEVPALGHDKVSHEAKAPACEAIGWDAYETCSRCDYTTYVEIPAPGHTPGADASCAAAQTCTVCGTELAAALSHTVVTDAAKAPTCTETGLTEGKHCSVCGEVLVAQGTVDALGHSYNAVVTEPTCTEDGYTTYTCSVCGDSYVADEVAATGHSYETYAAKQPTCTEEGEVVHTCACGHSYTETIEALGHGYEADVTEPTCTADGYTTYTCHCGDTYVGNEVPATGHTQGAAVRENETAAACGQPGSYDSVIYCTVCSVEIGRETISVDALGHDYDAVVTAPTCTEAGYTTYTCSACGDSYVDDEVEASGHSYGDGVVTKQPTCTAAGEMTYTCHCGHSYTEEIDKLEHDYSGKVEPMEGDLEKVSCVYECGAVEIRVKADSGEEVEIVPEEGDKNSAATVGMGVLEQILHGKQTLHLNSKILDVFFNKDAVGAIIEKHEGKSTISLVVEDVTEETDCLVFDLYLSVDGKKQESTEFGGEYVTVTIPLDDVTGKNVKVWYVKNGERLDLMDSELDRENNKVKFKTSHFSEFEVEILECEHSYVDGTCEHCGEVKPAGGEQPDEPDILEAKLSALGASYEAEVVLQFYFQMPDELINDDAAYAEYTLAGKTYTIPMEEIREKGPNNKGYYTVQAGIASGYMTYDVTVRLYDGAGNAVQLTDYKAEGFKGTEVIRSVMDYARLTFELGSAKQKDAMVALLTYGGYAQTYFKKDAENPAYNLLAEYGREVPNLEGITADTITQALTITGENKGLKYKNQAAVLESAIYLRNKFVLESGYEIDSFAVTVTTPYGSEEVEIEYLASEGVYYVDILEIASAYWDYMYKITVTNTETGESYSIECSVLAWVDRMLGASTNTAQINLGKAMYYYNQAANVFFNK